MCTSVFCAMKLPLFWSYMTFQWMQPGFNKMAPDSHQQWRASLTSWYFGWEIPVELVSLVFEERFLWPSTSPYLNLSDYFLWRTWRIEYCRKIRTQFRSWKQLFCQTQVICTEILAKVLSTFLISLHKILHLQTRYMEYVLASQTNFPSV
jgi:hypothetical protein